VGESIAELDAVVVSHEHEDHVKGIPVLCRRQQVPVYCTPASWKARRPPRSGADASEFVEIQPGRVFEVGDLSFLPFRVPHDAADCVGFRVETDGRAVGYATDLGHSTLLVEERLRDCDVLVMESNHDVEMLRAGPYPPHLKQRIAGRAGHLSNDATARLLDAIWTERTRHVFLAHLSETNNHPELALQTSRAALGERSGVTEVHLTNQREVGEVVLP
jgi:phosphoribosyl 1,2-cyclic phosphodiesterase